MLIGLDFIVALGDSAACEMARRQDLPKEAFLDLGTLQRLHHGTTSLNIISIAIGGSRP